MLLLKHNLSKRPKSLPEGEPGQLSICDLNQRQGVNSLSTFSEDVGVTTQRTDNLSQRICDLPQTPPVQMRGNMKVFSQMSITQSCYSCRAKVPNFIFMGDHRVCPLCRVICPPFENTQVYTFQDEYDGRKTFERHLKSVQGITPLGDLPPDIFDILNKHFATTNIPSAKVVRTFPKDMKGERKGGAVSITQMYDALTKVGLSDQYENIRLVLHLYWDWSLPDFSESHDAILHHYDLYRNAKRLLQIEVKINNLYLLWWFSRLCGSPYDLEDFKAFRTLDTLNKYEYARRQICDHLEWEFFPIRAYL